MAINLTVSDIAKMIDHSILHPTFTDADIQTHCRIARNFNTATVCVKPFHTKMAAEILNDSEVAVCSVIGFPQGNSVIDIKCRETEQVINDGAREVDMVINIGKVLQQDWNYIGQEVKAINDICRDKKVILKVIFETDYVTDDQDKINLCRICSEQKVAFVKTSTGYGFVKNLGGTYSYAGATDHDLKLMRKHCVAEVQIKAAGGIRTLEDIIRVRELGVTRVGATATESIMKEAMQRFSVNYSL